MRSINQSNNGLNIQGQGNNNYIHLQYLLQSLKQMDLDSTSIDSGELHHLDRMIMLGELVNGLAHELQNPLAGIQQSLQSLSRNTTENDPNFLVYKKIINTTNRFHELIQTILRFANKGELHSDPFSLNRIVEDCISAICKKKIDSVSLSHQLDNSVPEIDGDEHLLRLSITNILMNAMEIKPKGLKLQITTHYIKRSRNVDLKYISSLENPFQYDDGVIQLRVMDNGPGVPIEIKDKIFQPFFTTKKDGTGFGLYFSSQIVRQHRGCIFCQDNDDQGCTFFICLPVHRK